MNTELELQPVESTELITVEGGLGAGDVPKIIKAVGRAVVDAVVTVLNDVVNGAPK